VCSEELYVENQMKKTLKKYGVKFYTRWGSTIYHYEDLIQAPEETATSFTSYFRKSEGTHIRECVGAPSKGQLPLIQDLSPEQSASLKYLPNYEEFGFSKNEIIEKDYDR